jgi:hypothetical protein
MEEAWEEVFVALGLTEAELIKGKLESYEIPVRLHYESIGAVYGLTLNALGQVQVLVPADFAPMAREVLEPED